MLSAQADQKNAGKPMCFRLCIDDCLKLSPIKEVKEKDYFTAQINQAKEAGDVYTEFVKAEEAAKKYLKLPVSMTMKKGHRQIRPRLPG